VCVKCYNFAAGLNRLVKESESKDAKQQRTYEESEIESWKRSGNSKELESGN
jgi:hypothetical protein